MSTSGSPPTPSRDLVGPAELVLTATVARRFYFEGASKSAIAEELGLSRFKVARLLDDARASGLVRIELDYRGEINLGLSVRLRAAYDLRHCVVVDSPEDDEALLRANVGRAAAGLLTETVVADDVLGLAWARSLMAMRMALTQLAPCEVVQLTGALSSLDVDESCIELVRGVAGTSTGPARYFYAPMILPDAATAQALRTQPEVARARARFPHLTKAVVGIGAWRGGLSTLADAVSEQDRSEMYDLGVRAELAGIQLDEHGAVVATSITERLVSIDAELLRAVPDTIGVAYGSAKAEAVQAALRGGFVTSLVTHTGLASELLKRT